MEGAGLRDWGPALYFGRQKVPKAQFGGAAVGHGEAFGPLLILATTGGTVT